MATPRLTFPVNRRTLFKLGSSLAASLGIAGTQLPDATAKNATIYYLDPNCRSEPDICEHPSDVRKNKHTCNVCTACINHAKNKRWASEEAITRAHPCCRCSIKKSKVPEAAFSKMFGTGIDFNPEFDQRKAA